MHSGILRARQVAVFSFLLAALTLLLIRLFYLQALRYPFYREIANEQHNFCMNLPPQRGTIYDRNRHVLAVNLNNDSVFADPHHLKDLPRTAVALSTALGLDRRFVIERLSKDKSFVWLKRKVSSEEAEQVRSLKLPGIHLVKESKRFYPNRSLAAHVLGTVNIDNVGLEGLELVYDKYLKGEGGWLASSQDARRKPLESYQDEFVAPKNGFSLVLTIDDVIQTIAERELGKMYEKYHAKGASIIVIDPKNGDILAFANFPTYDLNDYSKRPTDAIRNRAINDFFEPGSVFKIVTASAALDTNAVRLDETFNCENGAWNTGKRILHDVHPYGILTFREIIEKSSNIGTLKVAAIVGARRIYPYMKAFGFYGRAGIDLPGEVVGMNRAVEKWTASSMLAIPMGQEVTVTTLQLACAIAVIADNGYRVTPRIVSEIIDENGQTVREFPPKVAAKVIEPQTAYRMRQLLKGVVENGTGKKARMEEATSGGKTGTAQKIEANGTYSHSKFIGSFIGFAPVEKPLLAVAVCVDEPHPVYYGGDVAAPVFREVVDASLKYLNAKASRPALPVRTIR